MVFHPDRLNARPKGALECGDSSPLSRVKLLPCKAACRRNVRKPHKIHPMRQQAAGLRPGDRLSKRQ
jgi:hypothetical protein